MKLTIHVTYKGKIKPKVFDQEEIIVGRKKDVPIDLDLAPDMKVSRPHLRLFYDQSTWWVEDSDSAWGTIYDGEKIEAGKPVALYSGDEIQLTVDTSLKVEFETEAPDTIRPSDGIFDSQIIIDEFMPPENFSEDERVEILYRIQEITAKKNGQEMLDAIVADLLKQFPSANRAGIVQYKDKQLLPIAFSPINKASCSFTLVRKSINERAAFIWNRKVSQDQVNHSSFLDDIVSAIYAPIIIERHTIGGVLHVDSTEGGNFEEHDRALLIEIANTIGRSIMKGLEDAERNIPSIFISFSNKDMIFVKTLAKALRRDPISVWFSERLRGGEDWYIQLQQAVNLADVFVLILSPDSLNSEWVQREINWAKEAEKTIVPILYRECEIPKKLKDLVNLHQIQYIDMKQGHQANLRNLVNVIYNNSKLRK